MQLGQLQKNTEPNRTNKMNHINLLAAVDKIIDLNEKLTAMTEQRDGLRSGIDYASDQLHKVTEQRDEARRLAEKYRYLSCDSLDEADETLLPWETTQPEPK